MSVFPFAWQNSSTTGRIEWNLILEEFFDNIIDKNSNFIKIWEYLRVFLYEYVGAFKMSRRNPSCYDNVVAKIKTHILSFLLRDNVEKYGRARHATDHNKIWLMCFACWMNSSTEAHSEYVITQYFPLQQLLRERASSLRYTYITCLVLLSPPWVRQSRFGIRDINQYPLSLFPASNFRFIILFFPLSHILTC
jgi:hypothetical protein